MDLPEPLASRPVFLAGMMGSGKSTVGRLLAERTGSTFIDLDVRIERLAGRSVPALFARGEPHFRELEAIALRTLLGEPGLRGGRVVVAPGGGTPIQPGPRAWIAAAGTSIYLRVGADALVHRLTNGEALAARPLLDRAGLETRIRRLLSDRGSRYEALDFTVDADAAPETVVDRIIETLSRAGASADGS